MHADACELASLEEAGMERCDVVIAATGDDKVNLVVSLLAKTEFAVRRVVARVNDPRNEWLFGETWGVDVAVSTPRLLAALVEEAVAVGDLVRLMTLPPGPGQPGRGHPPRPDTPLAGRAGAVAAAAAATAALVAILRGGRVIVPQPGRRPGGRRRAAVRGDRRRRGGDPRRSGLVSEACRATTALSEACDEDGAERGLPSEQTALSGGAVVQAAAARERSARRTIRIVARIATASNGYPIESRAMPSQFSAFAS